MKPLKTLFAGSMLAAALSTLPLHQSGCGKKTLEVGGAYYPSTNNAPDIVRFQADTAFLLAYNAIDFVFNQELNNRALLARVSPKITPAIDAIRPAALDVRNRYLAASDAYAANPSPVGLSTMQSLITEIGKIAASAQAALQR